MTAQTYLDRRKRSGCWRLTSQKATGRKLLTETHRSPFLSPYRELTVGDAVGGEPPPPGSLPHTSPRNYSRRTNFRVDTLVSCNIHPHHKSSPPQPHKTWLLICGKIMEVKNVQVPNSGTKTSFITVYTCLNILATSSSVLNTECVRKVAVLLLLSRTPNHRRGPC